MPTSLSLEFIPFFNYSANTRLIFLTFLLFDIVIVAKIANPRIHSDLHRFRVQIGQGINNIFCSPRPFDRP